MVRLTKGTVLAVVVAGLVGASGIWYFNRGNGQASAYRTSEVKRGDLRATISATGTVEPEEVVDVGAQVAGKINSFGKDKDGNEIDYGSVVEEGMVLAQIDDSLYTADLAQVRAQLEQAKAGVERAAADLEQMKAKLYQADRDWQRAVKLGPSEALAQSTYDAYKSAYDTAKANVGVGEAALDQARAAVAQAEAVKQRAERNLNYCTIRSPVKGVIIDRRVNIGQTVVASLNAPSLFLIAKDLKRMQVWVAVNEADIGSIHPGQPVSFTVDAYLGEVFRGEVGKVRLNATMTQNVVTYTVEVATDNSSGRLLPYLTANVNFELSERSNVLLVPNAALRWLPQAGQIAREFRAAFAGPRDASRGTASGAQRQPNQNAPAAAEAAREGTVWVEKGGYVRPVKVQVGLTDKSMTEVQSDQLHEGDPVVIGEQTGGATGGGTVNPFTPQMPRRR